MTLRRVVAFGLDWAILVMVLLVLHLMVGMLTLLSFGLLWPLHLLVLPLFVALAYHIAQIASSSAGTIGMRLFGLRAWSVTGGRPTGFQAVLHGVCLYGSMAATGGLIMLVALFNQRHQTLHDMLAGNRGFAGNLSDTPHWRGATRCRIVDRPMTPPRAVAVDKAVRVDGLG